MKTVIAVIVALFCIVFFQHGANGTTTEASTAATEAADATTATTTVPQNTTTPSGAATHVVYSAFVIVASGVLASIVRP